MMDCICAAEDDRTVTKKSVDHHLFFERLARKGGEGVAA
jgi:hypothetical protein